MARPHTRRHRKFLECVDRKARLPLGGGIVRIQPVNLVASQVGRKQVLPVGRILHAVQVGTSLARQIGPRPLERNRRHGRSQHAPFVYPKRSNGTPSIIGGMHIPYFPVYGNITRRGASHGNRVQPVQTPVAVVEFQGMHRTVRLVVLAHRIHKPPVGAHHKVRRILHFRHAHRAGNSRIGIEAVDIYPLAALFRSIRSHQ